MDSVLRDRMSMIAALGAGVVVGLSGIYLYYKLNRSVTRELSHLTGTIETLKKEIEELKRNRIEKCAIVEKKIAQTTVSSTQHYPLVASSSGEEAEEEYFDFTDSEDVSSSWATVNGPSSIGITNASKDHEWFDQIDRQLDSSAVEKEHAYYNLSTKKDQYSTNAEFLWRLAKATHLQGIMAHKRGELEKKQELSFEALNYAKEALQEDSSNPEVHKWYAITVGSLGDYVSLQEKIQNGYTFKKHVDEALKLKPMDPTLHHMLGRWCYEVAMLTWFERKISSTLFSTPPSATLTEGRQHLIEAENLKPGWKENILFIAKCFIGEGEYNSAIEWIDKALSIPNHSEDDELAHTELEALENQYKSYRQ